MFRKEASHQLAVAMTYEEEKGKQLMVRIGLEKIFFCSDDNLVKFFKFVTKWPVVKYVSMCMCACLQVNALDYYESEQDRLRVAVARERTIALEEKKLSIAFVTFQTQESAEE